MKKLTGIILLGAVALSGCKADQVEVKLNSGDVAASVLGKDVRVPFEASVSQEYVNMDDNQRKEVAALVSVFEHHFPGAEVEIDAGSNGFRIDVEGELVVSSDPPSSGAPWYIDLDPVDGGGVLVTLRPAQAYDFFARDITAVNMMLRPDEFQPVKFKFKSDGGRVLFGGAYADGIPVTAAILKMSGEQVNLSFSDGIWENSPGGFIYYTE